jgi:hypothetical protein
VLVGSPSSVRSDHLGSVRITLVVVALALRRCRCGETRGRAARELACRDLAEAPCAPVRRDGPPTPTTRAPGPTRRPTAATCGRDGTMRAGWVSVRQWGVSRVASATTTAALSVRLRWRGALNPRIPTPSRSQARSRYGWSYGSRATSRCHTDAACSTRWALPSITGVVGRRALPSLWNVAAGPVGVVCGPPVRRLRVKSRAACMAVRSRYAGGCTPQGGCSCCAIGCDGLLLSRWS